MAKFKSNLFCPNCAANNKIEQNFCRYCGLNLREISKSLLTQCSTDESANQFKRLKLMKKLTDISSIGLIIVVAAGILFYLYLILTKMVFSGERVVIGLVLIFMIFEFVMRHLRRMKNARQKEDKVDFELPKESKKRETAKFLVEKPFEPAASLTESSTQLLFAENRTKKME